MIVSLKCVREDRAAVFRLIQNRSLEAVKKACISLQLMGWDCMKAYTSWAMIISMSFMNHQWFKVLLLLFYLLSALRKETFHHQNNWSRDRRTKKAIRGTEFLNYSQLRCKGQSGLISYCLFLDPQLTLSISWFGNWKPTLPLSSLEYGKPSISFQQRKRR